MTFPRLISASATIGVCVWLSFQYPNPLFVVPTIVSSISISLVILIGGWKGFTVVYHAYVWSIALGFIGVLPSVDSRGSELYRMSFGVALGCLLGIRAARRTNRENRLKRELAQPPPSPASDIPATFQPNTDPPQKRDFVLILKLLGVGLAYWGFILSLVMIRG